MNLTDKGKPYQVGKKNCAIKLGSCQPVFHYVKKKSFYSKRELR